MESMDSKDGKSSQEERQRATAAEIARRKVLEAYGKQASNYVKEADSNKDGVISRSEAKSTPAVRNEDWRKYHTAWQDYYQNYYGKYYTQVAKDYVATEKLKLERKKTDEGTEEDIDEGGVKGAREAIRRKASGKSRKKRRIRRLIPIFIGIAVVLFALVTQYYRVLLSTVAAYVAPGNGEVNSITEIDPTVTATVGPEPRLIIPKINVDVPIVFGVGNDNTSLQAGMSNGVVHFAVPGANALPGQVGNLVISGHSSNGVFETGDYKFIFAPLERLTNGDVIYVNYESVRYTYTVTGRQVVSPTDVAALIYPTSKPILTLITCVPLGTARQRLLMIAEQISPDPAGAGGEATTPEGAEEPEEMPGNSPTLLENVWGFLTGR